MTTSDEAAYLLKLTDNCMLKALEVLERQLNVLHTRSQVLLSLAGVVVTVTGFSGRIIANTCFTAQLFIVAGLFTVLLSAIFIHIKVMHIKWLTTYSEESDSRTLETIVKRRNTKTKSFVTGGKILLFGLALYCIAISIMLFNPEPLAIAAR